jgi:hypothetical protein
VPTRPGKWRERQTVGSTFPYGILPRSPESESGSERYRHYPTRSTLVIAAIGPELDKQEQPGSGSGPRAVGKKTLQQGAGTIVFAATSP